MSLTGAFHTIVCDIRSQPFERRRRSTTVSVAVVVLLGIVFILRNVYQHQPRLEPDRQPPAYESARQNQLPSTSVDTALRVAVNQLFYSVDPSVPGNWYFPAFAKEKIEWIKTERAAGKLSMILLKNTANTSLDFEAMMAAGIVDGKPMIIVAQPRFLGFLIEGGRLSPPFTQQQRNDFMLGLVHETLHVQNPHHGNPASLDDRMTEELQVWREVDLNVVRQLRQLNQPLSFRFIEADDALRSCNEDTECQPLRELLLPSERRRQ